METTQLSKRDVLERLQALRADLRALGVRHISLFGSFVREAQHAESDVDLLVDFFPEQKSFDHFMRLSALLEDALGRRVELVTMQALSPHLGPHILREAENVVLAD